MRAAPADPGGAAPGARGAAVILANAWVVTMDDAGSEFERGFVRIEDGLMAEVGAGDAARARRRIWPGRS